MQTKSLLRTLPKFTFKVPPQPLDIVPPEDRAAVFLAVNSVYNSLFHDNSHLFPSIMSSDLHNPPVYNLAKHYLPFNLTYKPSSPASSISESASPTSRSAPPASRLTPEHRPRLFELIKKLNANQAEYCFGGALALMQRFVVYYRYLHCSN